MKKTTKKVVYTLSKRDLEIQEKAKLLVESEKSANTSFVWVQLELGRFLVAIKQEKGKDFKNVIVESICSTKKTHRLMKLVLKSDVIFKDVMKTTGTDKDIATQMKLMKLDEKIKSIKSQNDLSKIHNLSSAKVTKMKSLTRKDWDKVISGTDKPYVDKLKRIATEEKEKKDEEKASKMPKGMKKDDFDKEIEAGIYTVIELKYQYKKQNEKLERQLKSYKKKEQEFKIEIARYEGMYGGQVSAQFEKQTSSSKNHKKGA